MREGTIARSSILAILLLGVMLPHDALAQASPGNGVRVLVILDNSASMREHDPHDLRFTAARLFLSLLDEGDAAGIVLFATESRPLSGGLVDLRSRQDVAEVVGRLQPVAADGWTDVKAAFADAQAALDRAGQDGRRTVAVLLTDGEPEIATPYPSYEAEALAQGQHLGVPVLAIALTPAAHTPFLSRLAAGSGGAVIPAHEASDLLDAYLEVLSQIKDRTVVGSGAVDAPGVAGLGLDPGLTPYVERASFVVVKPETVATRFFGPDGQEVGSGQPGVVLALADDPRFAVVTVEAPPGGAWQFRLEGAGAVQARAILRSRLRVEGSAPGRFHEVGQPMPIGVHLVEEQPGGEIVRIIGEASFSALITRPDGRQESLDALYDDGTHGDARAGDGEYGRLYVNADQPGSYTIAVAGWKGVVPVASTLRVEGIAFPQIVVDQPAAGTYEVRGQPVPLQAHLAGGSPPALDQGKLVAQVTAPSGAAVEVALASSAGAYRGSYLPTEDGRHRVVYRAVGATYKGLPYTHSAAADLEVRLLPGVTVQAGTLDLGVLGGCLRCTERLHLAVESTSLHPEEVRLQLGGVEGLSLAPARATLAPGSNELELTITATQRLAVGEYEAHLAILGREGLEIEPDAAVPVRFRVAPLGIRCRSVLAGGGILLLLLVVGGGKAIGRARAATRPPAVSGTLRHWPADEETSAREIDLTARARTRLTLGGENGRAADRGQVRVADPTLDAEQAVLRAERVGEEIGVFLEPRGRVQQGYRVLAGPVRLCHGDRFSLGRWEFQYLSDKGG